MIKRISFQIIMALLMFLSIVLLVGNYNSLKNNEFIDESPSVYLNGGFTNTISDEDVSKIKKIVIDNNYTLIDLQPYKSINKNVYYYNKLDNGIGSAIDYFEGFRNDFINRHTSFIFEEREITPASLVAFALYAEDISVEKVGIQLNENGLDKIFNILEMPEKNGIYWYNVELSNYYFIFIEITCFIAVFVIYNINYLKQQKNKINILNLFGYDIKTQFINIFLNKIINKYLFFILTTIILLILYYRAYNISYLLSIIFFAFIIILELFITIIILRIKNKEINFNNFSYAFKYGIIIIIVAWLSYSFCNLNAYYDETIKEYLTTKNNIDNVAKNYYLNYIPPNATEKERKKAARIIYDKYNGFEYNSMPEEIDGKKIVSTTFNYFKNFEIYDIKDKRIIFNSDDKGCYNVALKDSLDILSTMYPKCSNIELKLNQTYIAFNQISTERVNDIIFGNVKKDDGYEYSIIYYAKNNEKAINIIKDAFPNLNYDISDLIINSAYQEIASFDIYFLSFVNASLLLLLSSITILFVLIKCNTLFVDLVVERIAIRAYLGFKINKYITKIYLITNIIFVPMIIYYLLVNQYLSVVYIIIISIINLIVLITYTDNLIKSKLVNILKGVN